MAVKFSDFWRWFKKGWKIRPYIDLEDKGGGITFSKEWNDPIEDEESDEQKHK